MALISFIDDTMMHHILIVEDEEGVRDLIRNILVRKGFCVTEAEDGLDALSALETLKSSVHPVTLVITDIYMPDMTGLELLRQIKKKEINVPVIAVSGLGNKEILIELLRNGCKDYLDKPFHPSELIASVEKILKEQEIEQNLKNQEIDTDEKSRTRLSLEIYNYKSHLDRFQKQIDSAVDIYQKLTELNPARFDLPFAVKQRSIAGLGGDFIDMEQQGNRYDILLADVAGHDIGASFHTILLKTFFEENCRRGNDGPTFFQILNRQLTEQGDNERMLTALFLRLDLDDLTADIVSAGHPPVICLSRPDCYASFLESDGPVLGIYKKENFLSRQFLMKPGDRLFLYSDGISSAARLNTVSGEMIRLGQYGLKDIIKQYCQEPLEKMVDKIWADLLDYCNHRPEDDMLLFALEIPPITVKTPFLKKMEVRT